jgi:hypothetical protein
MQHEGTNSRPSSSAPALQVFNLAQGYLSSVVAILIRMHRVDKVGTKLSLRSPELNQIKSNQIKIFIFLFIVGT